MLNLLSTILTLGGFYQSHNQHNREISVNNEINEKQLEEARTHHEIQINNSNHLQEMDISRELHEIQHTHNKESASREGIRDHWAQHNQKNQTSIITLTLLYSCIFVILVEGELPLGVSLPILIIYSIIISLEIICVTVSLILLLKVQSRMTQFNIFNRYHIYDCGRYHSTFESYYNHHCKRLRSFSVKLCNMGLLLIYISCIILISSKFYITYKSFETTILFVILNFIGLIIILFTLLI